MRVSQNMIYGHAIRHMNTSLTDLTRLNMMNVTQKRINAPSDDPAGMATVLGLRSSLSGIERYEQNIDAAQGWLGLADSMLTRASTTITSILEKAEQAATGTITADQRATIGKEVRELFAQLVSISNSEYAGQSIFAGHKTRGNAYEECLWATSPDGAIDASSIVAVEGSASTSILVEFRQDGEIGGSEDIAYRYSRDGGATWTEAVLAAGGTTLDLSGARLTLAAGTTVSGPDGDASGSRLIVRPQARYLGDDERSVEITSYGASGIATAASGSFADGVQVRIDNDATLAGPIEYSYSLDGGRTWVAGGSAEGGVLDLPGGTLALASNGSNVLAAGDSFTLRPASAEIRVTIGKDQDIAVNNVGCEIFGGLIRDPVTGLDSQALSQGNLFEAVGELIGYLETGDQDGVGRCLDAIREAHDHLLSKAGVVGARLNRLDAQEASLTAGRASTEAHLSRVEDADAAGLTIALARAKYIYEAVLATQSRVMGMSLLNYL